MRIEPGRRTAALACWCLLLAAWAAGCSSPSGGHGDASFGFDSVTTDGGPDVATACTDEDHDGFGINCASGPDCDDHNASVTDQCYRCMGATPGEGCPCTTAGAHLACDALTNSTVAGPDGVCHLGQRTCVDGAWSHCVALDSTSHIIAGPQPCPGMCDPTCQNRIGCITSSSDLTGHGTGVVVGTDPAPVFCPTGTPDGGVALPPISMVPMGGSDGGVTCASGGPPCGSTCCNPTQVCYPSTTTEGPASGRGGTACSGGTTATMGPTATGPECGMACPAGSTHCGDSPLDMCCPPGYTCHRGGCRVGSGRCMSNADCGPDQTCDASGTCQTGSVATAGCDCTTSMARGGCLSSMTAHGGQVVDDIFTTNDGRDARQIRFARYMRGEEGNPTNTPIGRANNGGASPYACTTCSAASCNGVQLFTGAPHDLATVSPFANTLDWSFVETDRYDPSSSTVVSDGSHADYDPTLGLIYDLGSPGNQTAIFPSRLGDASTGDGCIQAWEFTVWMTNNPNARTISNHGVDPNQWNPTTLRRLYTDGWTDNPLSTGSPSDMSNLRDTSHGVALEDGIVSIWTLPCGSAMRYVSIIAGNDGNPTGACHYGSGRNRIDAVAGLDENGNPLSIYHVLPYGASAGPDPVPAIAHLQTADLYILFDVTASMDPEIANLQNELTSGTLISGCPGGVIGGVNCIIPDVQFGTGDFREFPVYPYGYPPDNFVYNHVQDITNNPTLVQNAINTYATHGNYDYPEAQIPALWATMTGSGISGTWVAPDGMGGVIGGSNTYVSPRPTACPAGRFGYPCFRPASVPIVMMVTDAQFHNGPGGSNPYNDTVIFGQPLSYPAATAVSGNDAPSAAYPINEAANFTATGNSTGFASDANPMCGGASGAADATFQLTLTATREVHLDTIGSSFDTVLYVRNASGTSMGCNDDANLYTLSSELDLTLPAGTYTIYVDSYATGSGGSTGGGAYTLHYATRSRPSGHVPTFADAVAAVNAVHGKVIVLNSGGATEHADHAALANATGSVVGSGSPAVYDIGNSGTGLGLAAVNAVSDLANSLRQNVTAVALDNPATPIDERLFVRAIPGTPVGTVRLASGAGGEPAPYPSGSCQNPAGTSPGGVPIQAMQCLPGTSVNFSPEFVNNVVMGGPTPQTFTFDIVLYADGASEIGRVPVTIVVPPVSYPASGTFVDTVDASTSCMAGQAPHWGQLQFTATTPAGTNIGIQVQTATTAAGLASAPVVGLGTVPPSTSPLDVGAFLMAAGQPAALPYLRVTFTLNSDSARTATPTLDGYRVLFNCTDSF